MHCPACKEILKRRGELLYCTNLELDFPAEVSRFIDEAIADFESGARSSLEGDALPSQWHCLNCGSKMHYQGTNLVCEQCAFSIGGRIQHFMQNRVGHS